MRLVLLTNMYPYGNQEAFIEPEIKVLEGLFDEIHILSLANPDSPVTRYVPQNATVTIVSKKKSDRCTALLQVFKPSTWKEYAFVHKQYGYSLKNFIPLILNFYGSAYNIFEDALKAESRKDTIFYSYWLSHLSYALACFKRKHKDAFCISRSHGFDNFIDRKATLYRREIVSALNCIFPISEKGREEIEKRILPYVSSKQSTIRVFHLGIEMQSIVNPVKTQNQMLIVSCSFVINLKRLDIIISALSQIKSIPIKWVHFGGGPEENRIRNMAEQLLSNKSNISFELMGQTPHEEVIRYYTENHIDLFINCSDYEGIPVSVMEAMAAGIVCVARNVGGNRELIDDGDNGFLLPSLAGSKEYANLIENVYQMDSHRIKSIQKNAMDKVKKEYSSPKVYEKFSDYVINMYKKENNE